MIGITKKDVAALKAWSKKNAKLAHSLVAAQVKAQTVRTHVDSYVTPIFVDAKFTHEDTGEVLTNPKDDYLAGDEQVKWDKFYADVDAAHKANGYAVESGYCPALIAESEAIELENEFLTSFGKFAGVDFKSAYGELREQALKLALDGCLCTLV